MEMSDEKPAVSDLLDDRRGACRHPGGGPAAGLGCGLSRRRHCTPTPAPHHKPQHLLVGTRNQPPATADAGRLRHPAEVGAARSAVAESLGYDAPGDGPQPRAQRLHAPIARTDRTWRAAFPPRSRVLSLRTRERGALGNLV